MNAKHAIAAALLLAASAAQAATFTVTHSTDHADAQSGDGVCDIPAALGGGCTLRAALQTANDTPGGPHTIAFNLQPPHAPWIEPASPLPAVLAPVTIDGYTQPGASPNTLAVGNDAQVVIHIDGRGASMNAAGLVFRPGASGSVLRGVAVYGFDNGGVELDGAGNMLIAGNFIGTTGEGSGDDGTGDLANEVAGVRLHGGASHNTIGGALAADRNLIVGHRSSGYAIHIASQGAAGNNTVQGNYIGTTRTGNSRVATRGSINLLRSGGNTIAGNVMGAAGWGIVISGDSEGNAIVANRIGVGADDASAITPGTNSGQHGVLVTDALLDGAARAPQATRIGGSVAEGNHIAHWGGNGVRVQRVRASSPALRHHSIQGNRIHGNVGLGIELIDTAASQGTIPYDPPPLRVNNAIPTPAITSASGNGGGTSVAYALAEGEANTIYEFELFANAVCDPQGYGEGQTPLARFTATTDGIGSLSATTAAPAVLTGTVLTLTATRHSAPGAAQTSEFSACRLVSGGAAPGTPPAIGLIPNAQLTATVGQPYTLALAAHTTLTEGDPILAYALEGALPAWLSFNATTGVLTGTPATVGSHAFTATATDKDGPSAGRGFTITVVAAGQGGGDGGNGGNPPGGVVPVPTLGHAGLALLSVLLGAAGWRRRRA